MRHPSVPRRRRRIALHVAAALASAALVVVPIAPAGAAAPTARTVVTQVATATHPARAATTWSPGWSATLLPGSSGPAVRSAQLRLIALGYWVGSTDGRYGQQTTQAVLALQKTVGLPRTGVLDAAARGVLARGTRPQARSVQGTTLEIDLRRQLLLLVVNGRTLWAVNTSTGSGRYYVQEGSRHLATTPRGRFAVNRQIDGRRVAPLGVLYRPKYFYGGYAVHGSAFIPGYPASHGCARVSSAAIDWLWSDDVAPIGRRLWIY